MALAVLILVTVFVVSLFSSVHALGLWFFMMITHGLLVDTFGESLQHLPMLTGLMIVSVTLMRKEWVGTRPSVWILMSGLVVSIAIAALSGYSPSASTERLILYSKGFVLALFVAGVITSDKQIRNITLYSLLGVAIGVIVAFRQHITGEYEIDVYGIQRAAGLTGDPNDTAMLLLTGIPLAVYWITHSRKLYIRVFFAALFASTIGAIALTQSRGGTVALVLVLLLLFFRRPTVKAATVGIFVVCAGLIFAPSDYWDRMGTLVAKGGSADTSTSRRLEYVETGAEVLLKNPLFGVGMGNFGKAMVEHSPEFRKDDADEVAHNMYLEFFVENGVLAGGLFLALLFSALLQSIRYDRYNPKETSHYGLGFCVAMSLVAVMTAGLFLSLGRSSVLWFLVGVGLAFGGVAKYRARSPVPSRGEQLVSQ